MTSNVFSDKSSPMLRRLGSLLLVMIASSLVMAATVHARETMGPATIECSGVVHSDGDMDQSPGDADQAIPHHHGTCHGQTLSVPAAAALSLTTHVDQLGPFPLSYTARASRLVDPALRPPNA